MIGEHGDGAVVCASTTTVNGAPATVPLKQVRVELRARPGRISHRVGRTRSGPAGTVLSTLRKTLGLGDGTEELTAEHRGDWLGIPLRFTAGRPVACLPALDVDENGQLAATNHHHAPGRLPGARHPRPALKPDGDDVNTPAATRLHATDANVTVFSNTPFVTDWARRYFGSWWNAFEVPASNVCAGPLVTADPDDTAYMDLAALVRSWPHNETT